MIQGGSRVNGSPFLCKLPPHEELPMPEYDKDGRPIIDPEIVTEEKTEETVEE